MPFVTPTVRAAPSIGAGQLWISLDVPYTYVYDAQGDKIRTVQFSAAGIDQPDQPLLHARRPAARDARLLRVRSAAALMFGASRC